jgi:hypothetical protein
MIGRDAARIACGPYPAAGAITAGTGATVGDACVSSHDQDLTVQRAKLAGCDELLEGTRPDTMTHAGPGPRRALRGCARATRS